jgi:adenosylmethionine-8-amino-7-oxononanoate aminotransferase
MKEVCVKYGVHLIFDEVMCGMGRSGYWHAWQEQGVVPDIQLVGKGLAGGYAELSGMLFGHNIARALFSGPGNGIFNHGHTFQNFPRACASGLAVCTIIDDDDLLYNIEVQGELLRKKLEEGLESHPHVGNIRGKPGFRGVSSDTMFRLARTDNLRSNL